MLWLLPVTKTLRAHHMRGTYLSTLSSIVENGTKNRAEWPNRPEGVPWNSATFASASILPDLREAMLEGINFTAEQGQTVAFIACPHLAPGKSSLSVCKQVYDTSQGRVGRRRGRGA